MIIIYKLPFQSTLSVRRATSFPLLSFMSFFAISIHALREESDQDKTVCYQACGEFQSTLSVRRATVWGVLVARWLANFNPRSPWGERPINVFLFVLTFLISIHALREESDLLSGKPCLSPNLHFNPRSPWGERQSQEVGGGLKSIFQSTLSVRRATILNLALKSGIKFISIHALREESDKPS